jgi:hypothetical protein
MELIENSCINNIKELFLCEKRIGFFDTSDFKSTRYIPIAKFCPAEGFEFNNRVRHLIAKKIKDKLAAEKEERRKQFEELCGEFMAEYIITINENWSKRHGSETKNSIKVCNEKRSYPKEG